MYSKDQVDVALEVVRSGQDAELLNAAKAVLLGYLGAKSQPAVKANISTCSNPQMYTVASGSLVLSAAAPTANPWFPQG